MSLRARLVGATILVALVALTVAALATYTAFARSQLRQVDQTLQRTHEPIEQIVLAGQGDVERQVQQIAPGTFVAVRGGDGAMELSIPAREPGHDMIVIDPSQLTPQGSSIEDLPSFATVHATSGGSDVRVRVSQLLDGRILLIGEPLHEIVEARRRLVVIEMIVAASTLLVAGIVSWFVVAVGLRPLRRVEHTALVIAAQGELDHDVPGSNRADETGRLATALNTMLGRIRDAFAERDSTERSLRASEERMRRFVTDVSHELRTPLAAVTAYTELFERGARDHPDDLERALRGIGAETARMRVLVEELLLLARLDEGRPLATRPVDLNEIVLDAISASRAVAPDRHVVLSVSAVAVVRGDAVRLRQVVDNLLANVRTHTPAGTATFITIGVTDGSAALTVRDDGPGMPTEQAARIFERFYRSDASRSRASGGSGLGMAIVHALVTAHHGRIDVDTTPGRGLTIRIALPLLRVDETRPGSEQATRAADAGASA